MRAQPGTGSVSKGLCAGSGATTSRTWPGLWVPRGGLQTPTGTKWPRRGCSGPCGPRAVLLRLLLARPPLPAPTLKAECGVGEGFAWSPWPGAGSGAGCRLCRWPGAPRRVRAGLGWEGRRRGWAGRDPVREMMYGQMYQIAQDKQAVNFIRAHHGFNLAA